MPTDNDNNRSSALSPEAIGAINVATAAAVQEAIKAFIPIIQSMALTPEKIREINKPYEDPKKIARELRESLKTKEDDEEAKRALEYFRKMCPHLDKNGRPAICLVHNQPDNHARGVCVVCSDWIHPKEWRIGPPDDKNPRGKAYLVPAHKDYGRVLQIESMQ